MTLSYTTERDITKLREAIEEQTRQFKRAEGEHMTLLALAERFAIAMMSRGDAHNEIAHRAAAMAADLCREVAAVQERAMRRDQAPKGGPYR